LPAAGARRADRAEALRDDPRRQRRAVVHLRRARSALVERPGAHAWTAARKRLRGGRHLVAAALLERENDLAGRDLRRTDRQIREVLADPLRRLPRRVLRAVLVLVHADRRRLALRRSHEVVRLEAADPGDDPLDVALAPDERVDEVGTSFVLTDDRIHGSSFSGVRPATRESPTFPERPSKAARPEARF